ncbi:calcium-binding protein [Albimonas pacifica]|uniref:Hemolysin-type calcium-binding repeat-containing protein n=1 Tax=Albimonas pacifica TaxID=1114924 RepID=A0A1I3LU76_9RHOB|nr:calcium-binding protein [Albimonas pacifica]SFI88006.1 Hemolysin-type calcium-binding repeat-containing protein [Albimonas pacifica]
MARKRTVGTEAGETLIGDDDLRNLILGLGGGDTLHGGSRRDKLEGGFGRDLLQGYKADDRLEGGPGVDTAYGYRGDDVAWGGNGTDFLFGGLGRDVLAGGRRDDFLYGEQGGDGLFGGRGDDRLFGGRGDDGLWGGEGDDRLVVEAGSYDDLIGGEGADVFVIRGVGQGGQRVAAETTVRDFAAEEDVLRIGGRDGPAVERIVVERVALGRDGLEDDVRLRLFADGSANGTAADLDLLIRNLDAETLVARLDDLLRLGGAAAEAEIDLSLL